MVVTFPLGIFGSKDIPSLSGAIDKPACHHYSYHLRVVPFAHSARPVAIAEYSRVSMIYKANFNSVKRTVSDSMVALGGISVYAS